MFSNLTISVRIIHRITHVKEILGRVVLHIGIIEEHVANLDAESFCHDMTFDIFDRCLEDLCVLFVILHFEVIVDVIVDVFERVFTNGDILLE